MVAVRSLSKTFRVVPVDGDLRLIRLIGRRQIRQRGEMIKVAVGEEKEAGIEIQPLHPCYNHFSLISGIDHRAGPAALIPVRFGGRFQGDEPAVSGESPEDQLYDMIFCHGGIIACGFWIC